MMKIVAAMCLMLVAQCMAASLPETPKNLESVVISISFFNQELNSITCLLLHYQPLMKNRWEGGKSFKKEIWQLIPN